MSALLKIVQGPNAGAEIALPDGVEISVGKADSCDIVLADPTLPDAPLRLTASPDGTVSALIPPADSPAPLETAHVFFYGSSALAAGPADAPWPSLVFPAPPKPETPSPEAGTADGAPAKAAAPADASPAKASRSATTPPAASTPGKSGKSRLLRFLPALLALLLLLLLLLLGLLFIRTRPRAPDGPVVDQAEAAHHALAAYADRYNLTLDDTGSRPALSGNFATRADRLAATADLYSAFPGVSLDLTDDESLRTAVSDALFTLGETGLAVAGVSNRVATLSGSASSPDALSAALDALRADVPRLADVVTSAVSLRSPSISAAPAPVPALSRNRQPKRSTTPSFPVCGILATPYPCLVLQNGTRVFPGATLGGYVVSSISADSVVLSNATDSITWKP